MKRPARSVYQKIKRLLCGIFILLLCAFTANLLDQLGSGTGIFCGGIVMGSLFVLYLIFCLR